MKKQEQVKNLELNIAHVAKLSKFKLVRQVSRMTKDKGQVISIVKEMEDIEKNKKAFYDLFEEPTREALIKLDKEINKYYKKFCEKTPLRLASRRVLSRKTEYDQPDNQILLVRNEHGFLPPHNVIDNPQKFSIEHEHLVKYHAEIQKLASLLNQQEKLIECAIQVALKDERAIKVATELAEYLGYITEEQHDNIYKKIKR